MKILLLGYSNIARRKIINVFLKKNIPFCVASKTFDKKIPGAYAQFGSYKEGLEKSGANIVYISLPNSLHYYWAIQSLKARYHVIVDKPICEKNNELKKLIFFAKKNKKLLAEANFFNYHRQIKVAKMQIKNLKNIENIHVNFVIPLPNKNSILMSKKLAGGALMDMGPYAAAISRIFSKTKLISKKVFFKKNKFNLITEFSLLCEYTSMTYTALFKFGGEYHNELFIHTKKKSIKLEKVFSPPSDKDLLLTIKNNNQIKKIKIKKDDSFENFFIEILKKIRSGNFLYYLDQVQKDLNFRNKILKDK